MLLKQPLHQGELVLVNIIVSPNPGLIAQMLSFLTNKRYKYATVFVDNTSSLSYTHFQIDTTVESTLKGKRAQKLYARLYRVTIKAYYANHNIFKAKGQIEDYNLNYQAVTFASVNAYYQNGIAEQRIKQL